MFQQLSITRCCSGDAGTGPVRRAALPDTFLWDWDASRETRLGFSERSPATLPGWERSSALCVGVRDVVVGSPRWSSLPGALVTSKLHYFHHHVVERRK